MLMLVLLLPLVGTTEISKPEIIFKTIKSCPDVGYFFQQDRSEEFAPCYLCFCKADNKAVCSRRPTTRCDPHHYVHQKRKSRIARSISFNDIFLRDAAREAFNAKLVEQEECTPLRSSKSIGCPPDDWCTGCMVCDCDANGHWDCHLMSFCSTEKPSRANKRFSKSKSQKMYKFKGNVSQQSEKRSNTKKSSPYKKIDKKGNNDNFSKKSIVKKSVSYPDQNVSEIISVQTKRQFTMKRKTIDGKPQKSPTVIKKYISTMSPIKSRELLKYKNDPRKLAQMLYKQYMSNQKKNQKASSKNMVDMTMTRKASNKKNIKQTKQNMGDKIVNKKPANKKNIKKTKQNTKKSMFNKGNKDIPKIIPMKNKHRNKNNNKMQDNSSARKKSNKSGKIYKGKKFYNPGSKMRSKRDVLSTAMEVIGNTTKSGIADDDNTAHINQIANATEITFTNNEFTQQTLNNFVYTIENNVTTSKANKHSVYNITEYDTTENNVAIVTIEKNNFIERGNNISKEDTNVKRLVTSIDSELKTTTVSSYIVNDKDKNNNITNATTFEFNVIIDNITKTGFNPNQTVNLNLSIKNKVYGIDIKKIITNKKKFNLKKLVKTFNSGLNIENYKLISRSFTNTNNTRHRINGTLNNIQTVLEKFLKTANNTKRRSKKKHFTTLKYLRKLFLRLFSNGRNKTADKLGVMNSICDNFGPCNFGVKKRKILKHKVKELVSETQKALNSIKIIKGLLQLVHGEKKENGNATIKEANFKMHVRHLNAILRGNYIPEDQLTSTEVTQINYIKSNTKVFIKSIAKFGSILNDIINIIKSENTKNNKMMKTEYSVKKQGDSVNKLKSLLLKYNILQNTFLRKMYEALTKLEVKMKLQHGKASNNDTQPTKNETYKMAIAKYVQNINDNLKKLQDLASRVGSTQRRKRQTHDDDDAVEYLLTLMEYLLKRNPPKDTPPANDGIDLLIEAIKNAPEIKPIKKKVLQYVPVKINGAVGSAESNEASVVHRDNSIKNKDFSEDSKKKVKNKSFEDQSDNDDTNEDRRQTKSSSTKETDNTTKLLSVADLSDIITEYPSKVYMATFYTEENTARPFFEKQVTNAESTTKTVKPINEENRKNYVETDDGTISDDDNGLLQKARDFDSVSQVDSTTVKSSTDNQNVNIKMRHFVPINSEHKGKSPKKETKTKLDMINEAYEEEIKEERAHTTAKPLKTRSKGKTGKRNKKPSSNNISSITTEIIDDEKEKINEAELVYKKQMDLLNSLDYGTDRSVAEDGDSKDNSPVDRLSKDSFPVYFV